MKETHIGVKMSLDSTLDPMEETRFRQKYAGLFKQFTKKSHFSLLELEALALIYFKLQRDCGEKAEYISRQQFRTILHICFDIPEDTLMDRIFVALDKGVTPYVTLDTWISAMSLYLRGNLQEKIAYCFAVYDIAGDGVIRRDHMISLMKKSIIKLQEEDVEEAVEDFVDILVNRIDVDRDGAISFNDYSTVVNRTPALLECFGQCIPSRESVYTFLMTFTDKTGKF